MAALIDITGQRFGRLVALEYGGNRNGKDTLFRCKCDCGSEGLFISKEMRTGHVRSCGCLKAEIQTGVTQSPLYGVWRGIIQRCQNPNDPNYRHYGGRGIFVADEWWTPASFIHWAHENGYRKGLEVDRIDNDGPYSPNNCRFATRKENCRNMRKTRLYPYQGKKVTAAELSDISGIHYSTIRHRLNNMGMTAEEAIASARA